MAATKKSGTRQRERLRIGFFYSLVRPNKTMRQAPDMTVEVLTIITDFLSGNSTTIAVVVLLFIFRDSISGLISRLTSLFYSKGNSRVGLEAAPPLGSKKENPLLEEAIEKPDPENDTANIQDKAKEQNWFSEMHSAFSDGRIEDAEAAFKKYALEEKDDSKLEENKALYLYFKFEKGKDNSAIKELEKLANAASTEESKFSALTWLSFCLSDSKQYKKTIEVWRSAKSEPTSSEFLTRATVNLAYALDSDGQAVKAREELLQRLKETEKDEQLSSIYEAISRIETSLGNKKISVYCKDKSLEYDPNNRDDLFNSAYSASKEDVDEISISNYITLIGIDGDNAIALNNLGVRAQEADLNIVAVDNYKKSSEYRNTLAMANQGYLLLDAGFVREAEVIAQRAIEAEDTHQNVYRLLTAINKQKEEQNKKWEELSNDALSRQKLVRAYVEQYYLGQSESLEGNWILKGKYKIHIELDGGSFRTSWAEDPISLSVSTYAVELKGELMGSTFSGTYERKSTDHVQTGLLGLASNKSIPCIGFVSSDQKTLNIVSSTLKEDLSLCLSRAQA